MLFISVTNEQRALLTRVGEQVDESNDRLDFLDAAKKHLEVSRTSFTIPTGLINVGEEIQKFRIILHPFVVYHYQCVLNRDAV